MRSDLLPRLLLAAFGLLLVLGSIAASPVAAQVGDPQFTIANQSFWDYYQKRGGLRTFGYPISGQFELQGFQVQLFQRGVMQRLPDGGVTTMNLLDSGLMPYNSFNHSLVPAAARDLIEAAPSEADPDYAARAIAFVRANSPDLWNGLPVNFYNSFLSAVGYEDAFPGGGGERALLPLLNLEMWGLPTSRPAYDPSNHSFVYQRFQRGIMHYDATSGATQGLLLGDYLKGILTGQNLPPDVEREAAFSPFYRQYDSSTQAGPLRPVELPGTNLTHAFRPGGADPRFGVVLSGPGSADPSFVAAELATLGAGSWYSFAGTPVQGRGRVELVRPGANLAEVASRARARPGSAWIVGNEPNVPGQDDLKPAAYSDFLSQVFRTLKGADPSALLVGPNVLNWDRTCTGCPGYTAGHGWAEAFVADYRDRYGSVPLDVWGMHTYSLDWDRLPLADAAADQAQLTAARDWLDSTGLRLPLWLTEFGVIWGFDSIDWQQQRDGQWVALPAGRFRDDRVGSYLDGMLEWLSEQGSAVGVQRWFLYATAPPPEPYASVAAGITLLEPGRLVLTPLGERYRRWSSGSLSRE